MIRFARLIGSRDYVLQKAMSVVEGEQKEALFSQVRPQVSSMRRRTGPKSKHLHASKLRCHCYGTLTHSEIS